MRDHDGTKTEEAPW